MLLPNSKLEAQTLIVFAAAAQAAEYFTCKSSRHGSRLNKPTRHRERRSVRDVYMSLGSQYFRHEIEATFKETAKIHRLARRKHRRQLRRGNNRNPTPPPPPSGKIDTSVRLACALRYYAGGSPYDIMPTYGISHTEQFDSVWYVVDAVNKTKEFDIKYPECHEEQKKIAEDFFGVSTVKFDCRCGSIDGILIWTLKPTLVDAKAVGVDQQKFMCGRKHKFGLNCQAVCDVRGRFLDISITCGGASTWFTPYPNTSGGPKDNYNFFHSQLRIRIECAFGMLVQRWGILRSAMPRNISIAKTITLVLAFAKLHNFCIDAADEVAANPLLQAEHHMTTNESGSVPLVLNADASKILGREVTTPEDLIGGGEHFDDVPRQFRRRQQDDYHRTRLCIHVQDTFMTRPRRMST
ncbi:hypothetical protein ACHAWO_003669 [Cyclotella atomus]|uniref:DDE Tnp4 domain-containing protein n=1 Tax=Cyclotella atomus TaxID=382360 RepID=A0ABD3PIA1_9STRA